MKTRIFICRFETPFERTQPVISSLAKAVNGPWKEITPEIIKKSFKACGLNLERGWSGETLLCCFKSQPCKAGTAILEDQLSI